MFGLIGLKLNPILGQIQIQSLQKGMSKHFFFFFFWWESWIHSDWNWNTTREITKQEAPLDTFTLDEMLHHRWWYSLLDLKTSIMPSMLCKFMCNLVVVPFQVLKLQTPKRAYEHFLDLLHEPRSCVLQSRLRTLTVPKTHGKGLIPKIFTWTEISLFYCG